MADTPRVIWRLKASRPGVPDVVVGLPEGVFLVGREPGCHIVLAGKQVSRKHVQLGVAGTAFMQVEDLGSYNGTRLDGGRIRRAQLKPGDALGVGEWTLTLTPGQRLERDRPVLRPRPADGGAFGEEDATSAAPIASLLRPPAGTPEQSPAPRAPKAEASGLRRSMGPANVVSRRESESSGSMDVQWASPAVPEEVRQRNVNQSPLLRRITQQFSPLAPSTAQDLATLARNQDTQELALRLVYQVAAELQKAHGEEDFLSAMADTIQTAVRAHTLALLMVPPDGQVNAESLQARVVRVGGGQAVRFSRTVVEMALARRVVVATDDAAVDERFSRHDSILDLDLKAALAIPMLRDNTPVGVLYLSRRMPFSDAEEDLSAALAHLTALGIERARLKEEMQEQEALQRTLERFHTPEVVEKLMQRQAQGGGGNGLFLETITATVLFCDLAGFTTYCDTHAAPQVADLLNAYLGEMTRVVYAHHGTVDKFIGDAVMAVFGAPFPAEDDAARAVRCALEMQRAFDEVMAGRDDAGALALRVGVNTGPVVAGTVGSPMRMEYTCLGDAVNVAQRLEGHAPRGGVLVGPATAEALDGTVTLRSVGPLALKGKREQVEAFVVEA